MSERVTDKRPARFHLGKQYHVRWSNNSGGHTECIGTYVGDEHSPYDKLLKLQLDPIHTVVVAQTDITNAHIVDEYASCSAALQRTAAGRA